MKRSYKNDCSKVIERVNTPKKQRLQRKCLSLGEKLKLIDRIHNGEKLNDVCIECDINEHTLRSILKKEKNLRRYASNISISSFDKFSYIPRNFCVLDKAERAVYKWYQETSQNQFSRLKVADICKKVREYYEMYRKEYTEEIRTGKNTEDEHSQINELKDTTQFKASKTWYKTFRKRFNLDIRSTHKDESVAMPEAEYYPQTFMNIVTEGQYKMQQIFTATEFHLAWRRMPSRSILRKHDIASQRLGFDRISLFICNNICGDYPVKPLLVYRHTMPFCMNSMNLMELPVFWRSRPRYIQSIPKMTAEHFKDWLTKCFIPRVRDYLNIMELPEKCLLLLDAELQWHVSKLANYDREFLHIECLPHKTTPLLQPLRKCVVPLFRCFYFKELLNIFKVKSSDLRLYGIWRNFTILEAINIIVNILEAINGDVWRYGWLDLCKEMNFERPITCSQMIGDAIKDILNVGHTLPGTGFEDMTLKDVYELVEINDIQLDTFHIKDEVAVSDENKLEQENKSEQDHSKAVHEENKQEKEMKIDSTKKSCETVDNHDQDVDKQQTEKSAEQLFPLHINNDNYNKTKAKSVLNECHYLEERIDSTHIVENENNTIKLNEQDAKHKIRIINKAFELATQITNLLRKINVNKAQYEAHSKFNAALIDLMQPYKDMKEDLLQPKINAYF